MLETQYYLIKARILEMASQFLNGDEAAREELRKEADFFPISRGASKPDDFAVMMIRRKGELFLVEDTPGGERGVFAVLQPHL